jgi:hypothetical protein
MFSGRIQPNRRLDFPDGSRLHRETGKREEFQNIGFEEKNIKSMKIGRIGCRKNSQKSIKHRIIAPSIEYSTHHPWHPFHNLVYAEFSFNFNFGEG